MVSNYASSYLFHVCAILTVLVVSIDDHPMWLYAIDGRYVEPQLVDVGFQVTVWTHLTSSGNDFLTW